MFQVCFAYDSSKGATTSSFYTPGIYISLQCSSLACLRQINWHYPMPVCTPPVWRPTPDPRDMTLVGTLLVAGNGPTERAGHLSPPVWTNCANKNKAAIFVARTAECSRRLCWLFWAYHSPEGVTGYRSVHLYGLRCNITASALPGRVRACIQLSVAKSTFRPKNSKGPRKERGVL